MNQSNKALRGQLAEVLDLPVGDHAIDNVLALIDKRVRETVAHNRIELAKDIKHRHWANDKLRDAYLDAVIEVGKEQLSDLSDKHSSKEDV